MNIALIYTKETFLSKQDLRLHLMKLLTDNFPCQHIHLEESHDVFEDGSTDCTFHIIVKNTLSVKSNNIYDLEKKVIAVINEKRRLENVYRWN